MSVTPIKLLISDVDGTLVTKDKQLTEEAVRARKRLADEGILFTITSSRPPRGLSMYIDPLDIAVPLGAFNGGLMIDREVKPLHEISIEESAVSAIIGTLSKNDLSIWVYQGTDWFVLDLDGPHVAQESRVVQFAPIKVDSFDGLQRDVIKIVGVSDDPDAVARAQQALGVYEISATTSQTYYLDITDWRANKGSVVDFLSNYLSIERTEIATIGDMTNDVAMFGRSGISVAMGNATDEVKSRATHVTKSNNDNGFAYAIEHFILGENP
ncbi:MAG: Cof-type HAD-IIB family hydrolase [Acidimicrobiales bacterium]